MGEVVSWIAVAGHAGAAWLFATLAVADRRRAIAAAAGHAGLALAWLVVIGGSAGVVAPVLVGLGGGVLVGTVHRAPWSWWNAGAGAYVLLALLWNATFGVAAPLLAVVGALRLSVFPWAVRVLVAAAVAATAQVVTAQTSPPGISILSATLLGGGAFVLLEWLAPSWSAPAPFPAAPREGAAFGHRYRLRAPLGQGGQGVVWRMEDLVDGGAVVAKAARDALDASAIRWEHEALGLARSPSVLPVVDLQGTPEAPVLILPWAPGASLKGRAGDAGAPAWIGGLLAGLAAVHRAGLIHQDVKPSNLLLDHNGRAVLADLATARRVTLVDADATWSGVRGPDPVGSPRYMAPEVAAGSPPGTTSDVWSAGCVALELLTGRAVVPVREGESDFELRLRVASQPAPQVPDTLGAGADVLRRALSLDASMRYADAVEMEAAWRHAANTRIDVPTPITSPARSTRG